MPRKGFVSRVLVRERNLIVAVEVNGTGVRETAMIHLSSERELEFRGEEAGTL